jgi:hypothetical protein
MKRVRANGRSSETCVYCCCMCEKVEAGGGGGVVCVECGEDRLGGCDVRQRQTGVCVECGRDRLGCVCVGRTYASEER